MGLGDRRGLTLIEVVVATAIIMGVVLATSDGVVGMTILNPGGGPRWEWLAAGLGGAEIGRAHV